MNEIPESVTIPRLFGGDCGKNVGRMLTFFRLAYKILVLRYLIKSGGGTGPAKPGNRTVSKVLNPAELF